MRHLMVAQAVAAREGAHGERAARLVFARQQAWARRRKRAFGAGRPRRTPARTPARGIMSPAKNGGRKIHDQAFELLPARSLRGGPLHRSPARLARHRARASRSRRPGRRRMHPPLLPHGLFAREQGPRPAASRLLAGRARRPGAAPFEPNLRRLGGRGHQALPCRAARPARHRTQRARKPPCPCAARGHGRASGVPQALPRPLHRSRL